jgi:TolB-like protein
MEPSPDTCSLVEWIKATLSAGPPPVADRNRDQPTSEIRHAGGRLPSTAPGQQSVRPVEDRPTMAVLPFVDLSAGNPDEALVDGLTEEAIAALAQVPGLLVAARHSVLAYKGSAMDVRRIAAELGVKYALEASIRRDRMQLYANLRLIDGQTGLHLWAETFNTPLSDLMSVRDDFIRQSVIKLQPYLQANVSHHTSYPQPISQLIATLESMLLKKGFAGAFAKH